LVLINVTANVALRRPAAQSTTWNHRLASLAVDGIRTTVSCTTYLSTDPWWSVDLGIPMSVLRVCITNDHNSLGKMVVAARRSGIVVGRINEVTLRRARLVPGSVTVFGGQTTSVFRQATQANSASYPQRDGKWVPAKARWCSADGE